MGTDILGNKKIAVIGGGHIGQAMVKGWMRSGKIKGKQIIVSNPNLSKIHYLKNYGIEITSDNSIATKKAVWIFLAVKPLMIQQVLSEIKDSIQGKPVISLAAIVGLDDLKTWSGTANIIRIMPNVAISYNQGVIGIFSHDKIDERLKKLLSLLGLIFVVKKEDDLDLLTLISGCGPAIVSKFIELLAEYGNKIGLSNEVSYRIVMQTFKGTIALLQESKQTPHELIQSVATKGGITEAIIQAMDHSRLKSDFHKAMGDGRKKL